ncbi:LOW QUALITY PROTEIN: uncharacterized protein LOC111052556 [Nilaparvata lugens]|uniref:LOW QUALITY PROTEIN: uncharacterized protein LOC111052556 n=1 Tax=Nilaparvata lugens TaxID=108931 RepID=UPI00193E1ED8|nr:LOW QUALITY PROTEIN: uncharacterized protein LOC111052556 [Nilaparvata lugens]
MGCASSIRRLNNNNNYDDYDDDDENRSERRFSILGTSGRSRGGNSPLHLPNSKLTFSRDQLNCLNQYFNEQLDNRDNDVDLPRTSNDELLSLVERLVQRLLCTVGTLDPRFASMLLINAKPSTNYSKPTSGGFRLTYLVRLDRLSSPPTFEEEGRPVCVICEGEGGPQGFAKIRLQGTGCDDWAEFVNNNGYLRRDKIQERFVELLAWAVSAKGDALHVPQSALIDETHLAGDTLRVPQPAHIDETHLAGAPGKVIPDALAARRILNTPANQRLFYGPASTNRTAFPDPRDFRIAILDGGACVRLRVALLNHSQLFKGQGSRSQHQGHLFDNHSSADRDVTVTLTLGVEAEGWPRSADFPLPRTAITHCDALLYQKAATTFDNVLIEPFREWLYLVPCPPHPATRCDDRSATWQLRFPATEQLLLLGNTTANCVLATLAAILDEMHRSNICASQYNVSPHKAPQNVVSHLLATTVWFSAEQSGADCSPLKAMKRWSRATLSRHVLKCLDQLIAALQTQRQRSYFFPWLNVVLNPADCDVTHHHFTEEDYIQEAQLLHTYLTRLHSVSLSPRLTTANNETTNHQIQVTSELTARWSRLLADMTPSRQRDSEALYSPRQLAYIGQLFRGMLAVKTLTLTQTHHMPAWYQDISPSNLGTPPNYPADNQGTEDVVYLLSAILDQARMTKKGPLCTKSGKSRPMCSGLKSQQEPSSGLNRRGGRGSTLDAYETAVQCLMQQVRQDKCQLPYNDDAILVREVLRWLYLAATHDRKHLAPIVRPFLSQLFLVSHHNCWHNMAPPTNTSTDLWLLNMDSSQEAHVLGRFCTLVNCAGLRPSDGVVDALRKGWNWAAAIVEAANRMQDGVELVFTPREGRTVRHRVTVVNGVATNTTRSLGRKVGDHSMHLPALSSLGRRISDHSRHLSALSEVVRRTSLSLNESLAARFRLAIDGEWAWQGGSGLDQWQTPHSYLRANSPMTLVAVATANQGTSYAAAIVNTLIALNKFTVLQEVASLLPEDVRAQTLGDIRRITRERRRTHAHNRNMAHAQNSFSSQHSGATVDSSRSLVTVDSAPVINNRSQSCLNITALDNRYATYRSLDELAFKTADLGDITSKPNKLTPGTADCDKLTSNYGRMTLGSAVLGDNLTSKSGRMILGTADLGDNLTSKSGRTTLGTADCGNLTSKSVGMTLGTADCDNLTSKSRDSTLKSADLDRTLLGTCRLARSRQNLSTICDAAFFDAPIFYADSVKFNPCAQPLLALTADNRLTLLRKSQQCRARRCDSLNEHQRPQNRGKKEMVTKL